MEKKESVFENVKYRYVILVFLFFIIISFLVMSFVEHRVSKVKLEELSNNERRVVCLQVEQLKNELYHVLSDIHYIHEVNHDSMIDGDKNGKVVKDWIVFSNNRKFYDQIRYIDENGDEKIRVNYFSGKAYEVDKRMLQNKADRYYYLDSARLNPEEVYVSPLDLNIENGRLELPIKPMIRFATSMYNSSGDFKGIFVLNYLAEDILSNFKNFASNSLGRVYLLNSNGYWLSSDDINEEWNFMFDERRDVSFKSKYKEQWEKIDSSEGQIIFDDKLFTYKEVNVVDTMNHYGNKNYSEINLKERKWYVVSIVDRDYDPLLFSSGMNFYIEVIKNNGIFFAFSILIGLIIASLMYIIFKTYSKVKYYSEFDALTNTYNRGAGMRLIDSRIYNANKKDLKISFCFADINGLKVVNDTLGHEYGDDLIINSVSIIKSCIRNVDFVLRMGGDEFLIVFDGINKSDAEGIWSRIVEKFKEKNEMNDTPYIISISHGIVEMDNVNSSFESKLKEADESMYREKKIIKSNFNVLRENYESMM